MSSAPRGRREADLVCYYTNEISARARRELPRKRVEGRTAYLDVLRREQRRTVLEVGCGAGLDGRALASAGLAYTGVDLTPASVAACRRLGLGGCVASALRLPFADHTFDAAWSMSTLMHLAQEDFEAGLQELVRVLRPGGPVAIGMWGDEHAHQGPWDDGKSFGPARFFSFRTDAQLLEALQRVGDVEQLTGWPGDGPVHYQWALLRAPA